jgi:hypothetical protein
MVFSAELVRVGVRAHSLHLPHLKTRREGMGRKQPRNAANPFAGNYYDENIIGLSSMSYIFLDSTVCLLVSDVLHLSVILSLCILHIGISF